MCIRDSGRWAMHKLFLSCRDKSSNSQCFSFCGSPKERSLIKILPKLWHVQEKYGQNHCRISSELFLFGTCFHPSQFPKDQFAPRQTEGWAEKKYSSLLYCSCFAMLCPLSLLLNVSATFHLLIALQLILWCPSNLTSKMRKEGEEQVRVRPVRERGGGGGRRRKVVELKLGGIPK